MNVYFNTIRENDSEKKSAAIVKNSAKSYLSQAEEEMSWLIKHLNERTRLLERSNQEMEAFNYTVSHDLRAPLRHIKGFSTMLQEEHIEGLDEKGRELLRKICSESCRMETIIEDMLQWSRISCMELKAMQVNLGDLAAGVVAALKDAEPERETEFRIETGVVARGDLGLLRILMENLLGNAWKFTSKNQVTRIEFGRTVSNQKEAFFVRDNGVGFDMADADRLYLPFQRLPSAGGFDGTGIGLSTVQRIVHRHRGSLWAESATGQGATFYFTLSL